MIVEYVLTWVLVLVIPIALTIGRVVRTLSDMWQKYVPTLLLRIKMVRFRLGFRVSFGLEDLRQLRKYKGIIMERAALKDLMYGAIEEMMKNSKYYYHSSIGANYSHWTDVGKENLHECDCPTVRIRTHDCSVNIPSPHQLSCLSMTNTGLENTLKYFFIYGNTIL